MPSNDISIKRIQIDTGINACTIELLHNYSPETSQRSNRTKVNSLRRWMTKFWPAKWLSSEFVFLLKEEHLLFNFKDRLIVFCLFKNVFSKFSEISVCWYKFLEFLILIYVSITKNYYIITSSERISKYCFWFKDNLRNHRRCLIR